MTHSERKDRARRMVKEETNEKILEEEIEQKEISRFYKFREMLWAHIENCHERHLSNMEEGNENGAYNESILLIQLSSNYFAGG